MDKARQPHLAALKPADREQEKSTIRPSGMSSRSFVRLPRTTQYESDSELTDWTTTEIPRDSSTYEERQKAEHLSQGKLKVSSRSWFVAMVMVKVGLAKSKA